MRWLCCGLLRCGLIGCGLIGCGAEPECHDEAPAQSWESFGQGFLRSQCQGCHASTVLDRQGAPEGVVFDTEQDALLHAEAILATAATDAPTMPPAGGTSDADRQRLDRWLRCDP